MPPTPEPSALWSQTPTALIMLWTARQPEEERPQVTPDEVIARTGERAAAVLKYLHLKPARPMATPRQWEAYWNVREVMETLSGAAGRFGRVIQVLPGKPDYHSSVLAAQTTGSPHTIQIYEDEIRLQTQRIVDSGVGFPFVPNDLIVMTVAGELYQLAVERIGRPPRETWIDRLGVPTFQRLALGLPFDPLVLSLLDPAS